MAHCELFVECRCEFFSQLHLAGFAALLFFGFFLFTLLLHARDARCLLAFHRFLGDALLFEELGDCLLFLSLHFATKALSLHFCPGTLLTFGHDPATVRHFPQFDFSLCHLSVTLRRFEGPILIDVLLELRPSFDSLSKLLFLLAAFFFLDFFEVPTFFVSLPFVFAPTSLEVFRKHRFSRGTLFHHFALLLFTFSLFVLEFTLGERDDVLRVFTQFRLVGKFRFLLSVHLLLKNAPLFLAFSVSRIAFSSLGFLVRLRLFLDMLGPSGVAVHAVSASDRRLAVAVRNLWRDRRPRWRRRLSRPGRARAGRWRAIV
mmetsp:Transcript_46652/g.143859  ORF Transcript_46652/g.143859 Transcript_46652/m.143859 type:complete len:316 (-) Transcript_46652:273-1220(-)